MSAGSGGPLPFSKPGHPGGILKDFSVTTPRLRPRSRSPLRIASIVAVVALAPTLAVAVAILATAGQTAAVENDTLGIRPATESDFFNLSLYPGAALDASAIVSNYTLAPVTLLNYPVDGQTSQQGTFTLASQSDPRTGVGAWVTLDADRITVPANSELEVPFQVSVPAGTPPGDYAGGLIIQSPLVEGETSVTGDTAVRLDVIQRQGVRIYLNVAGTAVESLELGDLSWQLADDTVTVTLPLRNTGNTILHPSGTLVISSWVGANTQLTFDTPESILPGARLELLARLSPAPFIQSGHAEATVTSEAGTANARTSIVYAPWELGVISLLVLAAAAYGAWRTARFVHRARHAIAQVALTANATPNGQAPGTPGSDAPPIEPRSQRPGR